jgi:hypothetical protein
MPAARRTITKSATVGAFRAMIIVFLYSIMERDDINLDGVGLQQHYWSISPGEFQLLGLKLLIIAPLICLLGAVAGSVIDKIRYSAHSRFYRLALQMFMPCIFFIGISQCYFGLTYSESDKPFSEDAWQHGRINQRSAMVNDLIRHHKLIGMTKSDVEKLLGQEDQDAWPRRPKSSDTCLSYDLGHRSMKYGQCFVLYYRDDHIKDYERTFYKYF